MYKVWPECNADKFIKQNLLKILLQTFEILQSNTTKYSYTFAIAFSIPDFDKKPV